MRRRRGSACKRPPGALHEKTVLGAPGLGASPESPAHQAALPAGGPPEDISSGPITAKGGDPAPKSPPKAARRPAGWRLALAVDRVQRQGACPKGPGRRFGAAAPASDGPYREGERCPFVLDWNAPRPLAAQCGKPAERGHYCARHAAVMYAAPSEARKAARARRLAAALAGDGVPKWRRAG